MISKFGRLNLLDIGLNLKILHIITSVNTGGAEKFCIDLCNTQARISNSHVYLCVLDAITEDQPLLNNLSPKVDFITLNKQGRNSLKIIFSIYHLLSEIKPDIIHLNGRALIYASLPIIIKNIPAIYTVHTMAHKEYNKYITKYIKCLFNIFKSNFTPVAISYSVLDTIHKTYGNEYKEMIYNGSSQLIVSSKEKKVSEYLKSLKRDNGTLVFMYIGRIRQVKNTLLLIKAFNQLLDNNKNVCLCILGYDGSLNQSYLLECEQLNKYPEKIKFVGRKENIADYLLHSDALCLTSTYEGLGIVVLEAFSMGIPVLSTPSGGPSEIIVNGYNGYVSNKISIESYVNILNKFIENPLRNKKEIVDLYQKKFSMNTCAARYLKLYKKIINEE